MATDPVVEFIVRAKDDFTKVLDSASKGFDSIRDSIDSLQQASLDIMKIGGALTAAFIFPVKEAMDFEKKMSEIKAVTGATALDMDILREATIKMGESTLFSAQQAADALSVLASIGYNARESLGALPAILNLATAGQTTLAEATAIASAALRGMNLDLSELTRVTDVLAIGAAKSNATIVSLGEGLKTAGPAGYAASQDLETIVATLGALENAGIRGSSAGNNVKRMLTALSEPTQKAKEQLDLLGISTTDSAGRFRKLTDIMDDLGKAHINMGQSAKIFGLYAGAAAVAASGQAEKIRELEGAFRSSDITAKAMAATMADNLYGAFTKAKNTVSAFILVLGESVGGPVTIFLEAVQKLAQGFTDFASKNQLLVGVVMLTIGALGGIATAIGVVGFATTAVLSAWDGWLKFLDKSGVAFGTFTSTMKNHVTTLVESSRATLTVADSEDILAKAMVGVKDQAATMDVVMQEYNASMVRTTTLLTELAGAEADITAAENARSAALTKRVTAEQAAERASIARAERQVIAQSLETARNESLALGTALIVKQTEATDLTTAAQQKEAEALAATTGKRALAKEAKALYAAATVAASEAVAIETEQIAKNAEIASLDAESKARLTVIQSETTRSRNLATSATKQYQLAEDELRAAQVARITTEIELKEVESARSIIVGNAVKANAALIEPIEATTIALRGQLTALQEEANALDLCAVGLSKTEIAQKGQQLSLDASTNLLIANTAEIRANALAREQEAIAVAAITKSIAAEADAQAAANTVSIESIRLNDMRIISEAEKAAGLIATVDVEAQAIVVEEAKVLAEKAAKAAETARTDAMIAGTAAVGLRNTAIKAETVAIEADTIVQEINTIAVEKGTMGKRVAIAVTDLWTASLGLLKGAISFLLGPISMLVMVIGTMLWPSIQKWIEASDTKLTQAEKERQSAQDTGDALRKLTDAYKNTLDGTKEQAQSLDTVRSKLKEVAEGTSELKGAAAEALFVLKQQNVTTEDATKALEAFQKAALAVQLTKLNTEIEGIQKAMTKAKESEQAFEDASNSAWATEANNLGMIAEAAVANTEVERKQHEERLALLKGAVQNKIQALIESGVLTKNLTAAEAKTWVDSTTYFTGESKKIVVDYYATQERNLAAYNARILKSESESAQERITQAHAKVLEATQKQIDAQNAYTQALMKGAPALQEQITTSNALTKASKDLEIAYGNEFKALDEGMKQKQKQGTEALKVEAAILKATGDRIKESETLEKIAAVDAEAAIDAAFLKKRTHLINNNKELHDITVEFDKKRAEAAQTTEDAIEATQDPARKAEIQIIGNTVLSKITQQFNDKRLQLEKDMQDKLVQLDKDKEKALAAAKLESAAKSAVDRQKLNEEQLKETQITLDKELLALKTSLAENKISEKDYADTSARIERDRAQQLSDSRTKTLADMKAKGQEGTEEYKKFAIQETLAAEDVQVKKRAFIKAELDKKLEAIDLIKTYNQTGNDQALAAAQQFEAAHLELTKTVSAQRTLIAKEEAKSALDAATAIYNAAVASGTKSALELQTLKDNMIKAETAYNASSLAAKKAKADAEAEIDQNRRKAAADIRDGELADQRKKLAEGWGDYQKYQENLLKEDVKKKEDAVKLADEEFKIKQVLYKSDTAEYQDAVLKKKNADADLAESKKKLRDEEKQADQAFYDFLASILTAGYNAASKAIADTSDAAKKAYQETSAYAQGVKLEFKNAMDATDALEASLKKTGDRLGEIKQQLLQAKGALDLVGMMADEAAKVERSALQVKQAFLEQKLAIEKSADALDAWAGMADHTGTNLQGLMTQVKYAKDNINLLDKADLDHLEKAIEKVKQIMQEFTDKVKAAGKSLQDELDNLTMSNSEKEMKRYYDQLLSYEKDVKEARAQGNQEALAQLNENKAMIEEIHKINMDTIKKERQAAIDAHNDKMLDSKAEMDQLKIDHDEKMAQYKEDKIEATSNHNDKMLGYKEEKTQLIADHKDKMAAYVEDAAQAKKDHDEKIASYQDELKVAKKEDAARIQAKIEGEDKAYTQSESNRTKAMAKDEEEHTKKLKNISDAEAAETKANTKKLAEIEKGITDEEKAYKDKTAASLKGIADELKAFNELMSTKLASEGKYTDMSLEGIRKRRDAEKEAAANAYQAWLEVQTIGVQIQAQIDASMNAARAATMPNANPGTVTVKGKSTGGEVYPSDVTRMATGGKLPGGDSKFDSVPVLARPGEWFIRNESADHWGSSFMRAVNEPFSSAGQALAGMLGGIKRFASGGEVGTLGSSSLKGWANPVEGISFNDWIQVLRSNTNSAYPNSYMDVKIDRALKSIDDASTFAKFSDTEKQKIILGAIFGSNGDSSKAGIFTVMLSQIARGDQSMTAALRSKLESDTFGIPGTPGAGTNMNPSNTTSEGSPQTAPVPTPSTPEYSPTVLDSTLDQKKVDTAGQLVAATKDLTQSKNSLDGNSAMLADTISAIARITADNNLISVSGGSTAGSTKILSELITQKSALQGMVASDQARVTAIEATVATLGGAAPPASSTPTPEQEAALKKASADSARNDLINAVVANFYAAQSNAGTSFNDFKNSSVVLSSTLANAKRLDVSEEQSKKFQEEAVKAQADFDAALKKQKEDAEAYQKAHENYVALNTGHPKQVKMALGGQLPGGDSSFDSVPVLARPGEWFIRNEAVKAWTSRMGSGFMNAINNPLSAMGQNIMGILSGGTRRMAMGGMVGTPAFAGGSSSIVSNGGITLNITGAIDESMVKKQIIPALEKFSKLKG